MIAFDEAIELIRSVARPLGTENVALERASDRVLAAPVVAQIDSPREHVSAMDGYAIRADALCNLPVSLKVIGESFAGAGWRGPVEAGTCARIATGAPLPQGAHRIVIQEHVRREGDLAIIDEAPGSDNYVRRRGSDYSAGEELLPVGRLLDERAIVAAAAADLATVEVFRQPRLHILSTGDELAEPGTARDRVDAIPDSVSLGIAMLAERWGGRCVGRDRLRDDLPSMEKAARNALEDADVVVVTGGASVGDKDFAKTMFARLELELIFSNIAIKPGKPAWLGRAGGKLVIGLPGNPTSAMVTARLLLAPLISAMAGRAPDTALQWTTARLTTAIPACGQRETFHRARLRVGEAEILSFQDSSAQKALAEADVLVRQRANSSEFGPGDQAEVLAF